MYICRERVTLITMATIRELSLSELRRNLHAHPETGWKEFRTTALIAEELEERDFVVHLGADAVNPDSRMGVPDDVPAARERAREEGATRGVHQPDGGHHRTRR